MLFDGTVTPDDVPELTGSQVLELDGAELDFPPAAPDNKGMVADLLGGDTATDAALGLEDAPLVDALDELSNEEDESDPELESELDSADFFVQQDLFEDAREAILEVLKRRPLYARAISMLDEVEAKMGLRRGPDGSLSPVAPAPQAAPPPPQAPQAAPQAVARGMSEVTDPGQPPHGVPPATTQRGSPIPAASTQPYGQLPTAQASVPIASDPDSRFEAGLAYKDMGLIDQAIAEFEAVSQSPMHALNALVMLGHCQRAKGDPIGAVGYFHAAFNQTQDPTASMELKYEIASACEEGGALDKAIEWYQAVVGDDPAYRDAGDKVAALAAVLEAEARNGAHDYEPYGGNGSGGAAVGGHAKQAENSPKKNKITYL
jgi:tetratricopeptide (TPR) repeat protein